MSCLRVKVGAVDGSVAAAALVDAGAAGAAGGSTVAGACARNIEPTNGSGVRSRKRNANRICPTLTHATIRLKRGSRPATCGRAGMICDMTDVLRLIDDALDPACFFVPPPGSVRIVRSPGRWSVHLERPEFAFDRPIIEVAQGSAHDPRAVTVTRRIRMRGGGW